MPRRLSLALLTIGARLLAIARFAGASPTTAGIFRVGYAGASVQIDPQVSYITTGWWLEYATAATLYNWSDRGTKLVPEVASGFAVSNYGRTYTFLLRKGILALNSQRSPLNRLAMGEAINWAVDRPEYARLAGVAAASPAANIYAAMGVRRSDLDLGVSVGWCAAEPDPYALISTFFSSWNSAATNSPKYRAKLDAAHRLRGNARLRAFGKLDLQITRNVAPGAFMRTYNNRYFFPSRVDPRSLAHSGVYGDWSIPVLALK